MTHKVQVAWNTGLTKDTDERVAQRKSNNTWQENFKKTPEQIKSNIEVCNYQREYLCECKGRSPLTKINKIFYFNKAERTNDKYIY